MRYLAGRNNETGDRTGRRSLCGAGGSAARIATLCRRRGNLQNECNKQTFFVLFFVKLFVHFVSSVRIGSAQNGDVIRVAGYRKMPVADKRALRLGTRFVLVPDEERARQRIDGKHPIKDTSRG